MSGPSPSGVPALSACPFCGGWGRQSKVLRDGYDKWKDDPEGEAWAHFVVCNSCSAQGGWAKTPGNAVRLWNARAGQ